MGSPLTAPWFGRALLASALGKATGDDFLHDFVRATVDWLHARIQVMRGDGVLHHEAIATMHLQRVVHHFDLQIRGPPLGHRRSCLIKFALDFCLNAGVDE